MQALWSHIPRKSLEAEQLLAELIAANRPPLDLANVSFAWVLHSTDGAPILSEADVAIVVTDLGKFAPAARQVHWSAGMVV
jgi:hypothetical protein